MATKVAFGVPSTAFKCLVFALLAFICCGKWILCLAQTATKCKIKASFFFSFSFCSVFFGWAKKASSEFWTYKKRRFKRKSEFQFIKIIHTICESANLNANAKSLSFDELATTTRIPLFVLLLLVCCSFLANFCVINSGRDIISFCFIRRKIDYSQLQQQKRARNAGQKVCRSQQTCCATNLACKQVKALCALCFVCKLRNERNKAARFCFESAKLNRAPNYELGVRLSSARRKLCPHFEANLARRCDLRSLTRLEAHCSRASQSMAASCATVFEATCLVSRCYEFWRVSFAFGESRAGRCLRRWLRNSIDWRGLERKKKTKLAWAKFKCKFEPSFDLQAKTKQRLLFCAALLC